MGKKRSKIGTNPLDFLTPESSHSLDLAVAAPPQENPLEGRCRALEGERESLRVELEQRTAALETERAEREAALAAERTQRANAFAAELRRHEEELIEERRAHAGALARREAGFDEERCAVRNQALERQLELQRQRQQARALEQRLEEMAREHAAALARVEARAQEYARALDTAREAGDRARKDELRDASMTGALGAWCITTLVALLAIALFA